MVDQIIRCDECGCKNGVPSDFLLEAYCRRCQNALTLYTRFRSLTRSRALGRSMQLAGVFALLIMMFGSDVAEWWASEPFSLKEAQASVVSVADLPEGSLALENE